MAAVESYANDATTTLAAGITDVQSSITVTSASGFPSSGQYRITVGSEIMLVTAGQGTTTWTVTRGVESTTAAAALNGATVEHRLTKAALEAVRRRASLFVAASNASAASLASADYVCDGTADQVEINAALAAISGTAGGRVVLSEGTFSCTAPVLVQLDSTVLEGSGLAYWNGASQGIGTRIEAASGVTSQLMLVQRALDDRPVYGVVLRNFVLDGRSLAGPVNGLVYRSHRGVVDNVHAVKFSGSGIVSRGYSGWAAYDSQFTNCKSAYNTADGFLFDTRGEDQQIIGCVSMINGGNGFNVQTASQQFVACHAYDNDGKGFSLTTSGSRNKFLGCKIEGNNGGIYIEGPISHVIISGCGFKDNSRTTTNTTDHINIGGSSGSNLDVITGCNFVSTVTNKARYGINLVNSNATATLIVGNSFASGAFGTAAVNNSGGTSAGYRALIRDNWGVVTENSGTTTITTGNTSVSVTHGLAFTPRAHEISVVPTNSPTNDPGWFYITSVGATTFTINVRTNPGASGASFAWSARLLTEVA